MNIKEANQNSLKFLKTEINKNKDIKIYIYNYIDSYKNDNLNTLDLIIKSIEKQNPYEITIDMSTDRPDGTKMNYKQKASLNITNQLISKIINECKTKIINIKCDHYFYSLEENENGFITIPVNSTNQEVTIRILARLEDLQIPSNNLKNINLYFCENEYELQINQESFEYKDSKCTESIKLSQQNKKQCIEYANHSQEKFIGAFVNKMRTLVIKEQIINSKLLYWITHHSSISQNMDIINITGLTNFTIDNINKLKETIRTMISITDEEAGHMVFSNITFYVGFSPSIQNISYNKKDQANIDKVYKLLDSLIGKNKFEIENILNNSNLIDRTNYNDNQQNHQKNNHHRQQNTQQQGNNRNTNKNNNPLFTTPMLIILFFIAIIVFALYFL